MVLPVILGAVAVCGVGLIVRGSTFKTTERVVESKRLPDAFDGFRISVLSDLHDRKADYRALAQRVERQKPDIILLPGDLHNAGCKRNDYVRFLEQLAPIAPCFYVTGNHEPGDDRSEEQAQMMRLIRGTGVTVLDGLPLPIERNGQYISLVGTMWRHAPCTFPSDYCIHLYHSPDIFDCSPCADLTVSGHVHGGFIRLPFIGPVFAPGEGCGILKRFAPRFFFPKYGKGLYNRDEKTLYVSEGLGFTAFPPFRLIRGEVGCIVLKKI